jgi:preprotein translocase subunit SecA
MHRSVIYQLRDKVLAQEELRPTIEDMVSKELNRLVAGRLQGEPADWDTAAFLKEFQSMLPPLDELSTPEAIPRFDPAEIEEMLQEHADKTYDARIEQFGADLWKQVERIIMLRTIDRHWVEHLTAMDNMRTGIGLEAVGQRDPLVQYKQTAYGMFGELMENIERDIAHTIFRVAPQAPPPTAARAPDRPPAPTKAGAKPDAKPAAPPTDGASKPAAAPTPRGQALSSILRQKSVMSNVAGAHGTDSSVNRKVGRNAFCPCGSGKKYKRCHGANA